MFTKKSGRDSAKTDIQGFGSVSGFPRSPKQRGSAIRRRMLSIVLSACAMWLAPPAYLIFDFMIGGPYLTAFSLKYLNLATDAKLVGRPEEDVVTILGHPTEIRIHDRETAEKRFVYSPVSYFPIWSVQVQCREGVVVSVEPWDD